MRAAAVTLLALVLAVGTAAPASATMSTSEDLVASTTWSLQPADADGPDGRVSLRHVLEGGATVSDHLALTNYGDRAARFAVYASDGVVTQDGLFDLLTGDEEPTGGGAWTTVLPGEVGQARERGVVVEVAADSTVVLPVRIDVPTTATPGDHPAGVVAELVRGGDDRVGVASRVGVRMHLRVAGDVVGRLEPEVVAVSYRPSWNPFARGRLVVEVDVANTGNVRLGSREDLTASGPWRLAPAGASGEHREVLPGQSSTTVLEVPVVPLVRTWGDVVVTPVVVGEDEVDVALEPGSASLVVWTMPWAQLALVLALVGAVLGARAHRRRTAARIQARIDAAVAQATAGQAP